MDTTDPDIGFDADGVCTHCLTYDERFRDVVDAAQRGDRIDDFRAIAERIKADGADSEYDCIVGVSGGVDSSYVLVKAKEFGLRPLAVHFDSGWNSELAVSNIESLTSRLGVDLKTDVVDWKEMRDLQLSFFRAGVTNCDIPTDHAFPAVALRNAAAYDAKYILSGSNMATESVLPTAWGHNSADLRYLKAIQRRHGTVRLRNYPTLGMLKRELWFRTIRRVRILKPLDYLPYDKAQAKAEIAELGWRDYGGKHYESIFTRFFQGYYLPERFGYDKRLAHLSSLILSGQTTREEALATIEGEPTYPLDLQASDRKFVAKKLGISEGELQALIEAPLSQMQDYPTNDAAYRLAFRARELVTRG